MFNNFNIPTINEIQDETIIIVTIILITTNESVDEWHFLQKILFQKLRIYFFNVLIIMLNYSFIII